MRLPWHGGHGRRTARRGAARGRPGASGQAGHPERRCLPPRPWRANVLLVGGEAQRGWRRRLWGGWSSQASPRPRRRLARPAATTCRRRAWDRRRAAPVVPPAGAEVVPAGTADRGEALGGAGGHGPDCGGKSVSPPPPRSGGRARRPSRGRAGRHHGNRSRPLASRRYRGGFTGVAYLEAADSRAPVEMKGGLRRASHGARPLRPALQPAAAKGLGVKDQS